MNRSRIIRTGIFAGGVLLAALAVQSFVLPRVVVARMERALKIKVTGRIRPQVFRPAFHVDGVRTDWDRKIRIFSGRVDVRYNLTALGTGRLALQLQGRQVASELLGDWALLAGGQKVVFDDVFADFLMDAHGIREIRALRAESPSIHFNFGISNGRRETQA